MNVVAKIILDLRYTCNKGAILRLCSKRNYQPNISHLLRRRISTLRRLPEEYRRFALCRKCSAVALKQIVDTNNVEHNQKHKPESEVALLYALFHESVHYSNTVAQPMIAKMCISNEEAEKLLDADWTSANTLDMYNAVKKLAYNYLNTNKVFSSERYDNILAALREKLYELDDQKFKKLLQLLKPLLIGINKSAYFPSFMQEINKECLKRFYGPDFNELLLTVDMLLQLKEVKGDYLWRAMRKMGTKPHKLTSNNLVQYMFFLSYTPSIDINLFEIEHRFSECIDDLSPKELCVASLGFFRTKTVIKNPDVINKFMRKIMGGLNDLESIHLASAMKIIRYSTKLREISVFRIFLSALVPHVPRLSLICLMHIAHAAANAGIYERDLMNAIIDRFINEVSYARIKDIERLTFATTTVCPEMSDQALYDTIVENLLLTYNTSRAVEIEKHARALPRILSYLSCKNIYPQELIKFVLDPKYIHKLCYGKPYVLSRDIFTLHHNVLIDCPSYTGPLLEKKVLNILTKKFCKPQANLREGKSRTLIIEIMYTCKDVLKLDLYCGHVAPNFDLPDIIIALDEHKNIIPIEHILSAMPFGDFKRVDTDDLKKFKWFALVIVPFIQIVKGSDKYVGPVYSKLRHLKAIGYTPIPISQIDWDRFATTAEKVDYIKGIVFEQNKEFNSQNP